MAWAAHSDTSLGGQLLVPFRSSNSRPCSSHRCVGRRQLKALSRVRCEGRIRLIRTCFDPTTPKHFRTQASVPVIVTRIRPVGRLYRGRSLQQHRGACRHSGNMSKDRWHLLKNLREAIERLLERQSDAVDEAMKAAATAEESPQSLATADIAQGVTTAEPTSPPQPLTEPPPESPRFQAQRARRTRRIERFEQVHERHPEGHSSRRIAREIGMSRNAVRHYPRCKECPDWRPGGAWRSRWDAHREWIDARIAEGCTNAADLHRQLMLRDFRGSCCSMQRHVRKRLGVAGKNRERAGAARPSAPPAPSPRQLPFEWGDSHIARSDDGRARTLATA
jgi:hypothetical protein